MPLLDFKCDQCGFTDEYLVGANFQDGKSPTKCPKCEQGKMERLFTTGNRLGIDFVGPGFYINDYGKHNWKKNLSISDQAKVLTPDENGQYKDPY